MGLQPPVECKFTSMTPWVEKNPAPSRADRQQGNQWVAISRGEEYLDEPQGWLEAV